jgi:hypothetical protein
LRRLRPDGCDCSERLRQHRGGREDLLEPHRLRVRGVHDHGARPQHERALELVDLRPRPAAEQGETLGKEPSDFARPARARGLPQLFVDLIDLRLELAVRLRGGLLRVVAHTQRVEVRQRLRPGARRTQEKGD